VGGVYNLGGGRENSISLLESINCAEKVMWMKLDWTYVDENRIGDHIFYISDLTKIKSHLPDWSV